MKQVAELCMYVCMYGVLSRLIYMLMLIGFRNGLVDKGVHLVSVDMCIYGRLEGWRLEVWRSR